MASTLQALAAVFSRKQAQTGSKHKFSKAISVTNIKHQVKQNLIDKNLVQKCWFFAESGCSDIFNCFLHYGTPTLDPDAYVQAMLAQAGNLIDQIYKLGARRIALFSLGRPVGCNPARALLPGAPVDKCSGKMNLIARDWKAWSVICPLNCLVRLVSLVLFMRPYRDLELLDSSTLS
ncbi:hypothetical protein H0E87_019029 [Populus deltoides]|uniref:Uncharacterized protein n=1 Tax=Populus deltoides TaxID=3696 RepID=A0A8T2XTQ1_POPDE|nr:hypothetical protein H0E87_019029 [Populus deltoides]